MTHKIKAFMVLVELGYLVVTPISSSFALPAQTDTSSQVNLVQPQAWAPGHPRAFETDELRRRIEEIERELELLKNPPPPSSTAPAPAERPRNYADGFHFRAYGRAVAASDHEGRPPANADILQFTGGSRLDEATYTEFDLRREDYWEGTDSYTKIVTIIAFNGPILHFHGKWDVQQVAVRDLYVEERGFFHENLSIWIGSRMHRGNDAYLLDFWPLDNLDTIGGGVTYRVPMDFELKLHIGANQPRHPFFVSSSPRPFPLQDRETAVRLLDRQRILSSGRVSKTFPLNDGAAGIAAVLYGEFHHVPEGERENEGREEAVPAESGFVAGGQVSYFTTGNRPSHLHLFVRYARGLGVYDELRAPTQLAPDGTTARAWEMLFAFHANLEAGAFGMLASGFVRKFRNASPGLDFQDVTEGIIIARPTVWFGEHVGLSLEASYQAQKLGVRIRQEDGRSRFQVGHMARLGVVPFLTPGGRGNYKRPQFRFIYLLSHRDEGARRLYPQDNVFAERAFDHFFGLNVEWWFTAPSYFPN